MNVCEKLDDLHNKQLNKNIIIRFTYLLCDFLRSLCGKEVPDVRGARCLRLSFCGVLSMCEWLPVHMLRSAWPGKVVHHEQQIVMAAPGEITCSNNAIEPVYSRLDAQQNYSFWDYEHSVNTEGFIVDHPIYLSTQLDPFLLI